jgi:hypothetical protein
MRNLEMGWDVLMRKYRWPLDITSHSSCDPGSALKVSLIVIMASVRQVRPETRIESAERLVPRYRCIMFDQWPILEFAADYPSGATSRMITKQTGNFSRFYITDYHGD